MLKLDSVQKLILFWTKTPKKYNAHSRILSLLTRICNYNANTAIKLRSWSTRFVSKYNLVNNVQIGVMEVGSICRRKNKIQDYMNIIAENQGFGRLLAKKGM